MLSLKDIAAAAVAIEICNNSQLKKEILCLTSSEYGAIKEGPIQLISMLNREKEWKEIIEKKAAIILENLGQPKQLQIPVTYIIPSIGRRILTWAVYHERIIGFSRSFSFKFFNSSFFTPLGIIDCKKTAEEMMKDKNSLSIFQKYKLALLYCMNEHIPDLYTKLTDGEKKELYNYHKPYYIRQPHFIKFWHHYLNDEVDKLREDEDRNLYWLKIAVKSGNKYAVEYCLEKTDLIKDGGAVIYAALEAAKNVLYIGGSNFIFSEHRFRCLEPFVPDVYYIDIVIFLFWKMNKNQQMELLNTNLEGTHYNHDGSRIYGNSCILSLFLEWPYQKYFMKIARMFRKSLRGTHYLDLVIYHLFNKIGIYNRGELRDFDYKKLLGEFWMEIPEVDKRYIRSSQLIFNKALLLKLFTLQNFTHQDWMNIKLMLNSVTVEMKHYIISSAIGERICIELMKLERWEVLDEFVAHCCASKQKIEKFKKEFSLTEKARRIYKHFTVNDEWNAVDSFITWSSLSEEEINQLK